MTLKIMVAASNELVREALVFFLGLHGDMDPVAQASSGPEAACLAARVHPNIATVDLALAPVNGLAAIRDIQAASAGTAIILFSIHCDIEYVRQAFEAGARGYLLAESLGAELARAVREVSSGGCFVSPRIGALPYPPHTTAVGQR